jgi:hypothetical protein
MAIEYPEYHENEVWNVPDNLFHHSLGLLLGGKQAAKRLGCCKQILYRNADSFNLTVVRRNLLHGGRYFLVTEIDALIRKQKKEAQRFGRKSVEKIAQRGY